jgi:DNA-binding SARP family transcriptional activator
METRWNGARRALSVLGELILSDAVHLGLLGGFECTCAGNRLALPLGAQRLLALLALRDGGVHRASAAERLWPDSSAARAAGNLRSALWRGRRVGDSTVIECVGPRLRLASSVCVDLRQVHRRIQEVLDGGCCVTDRSNESLVVALSQELLPDWTDDWLVLDRERWDQVRLHALEGVAEKLLSRQQYLDALKTALAAVAVEPIRETAHRIVIEVHLAEGNAASALRHYQRYRAHLHRELGVAPSPRMARLASTLLPS